MPKHDPGTVIKGFEYYTAQDRWVKFWRDHQKEPVPNFAGFLGMHSGGLKIVNPNAFGVTYKVRRSAANKIAKLNSPHWYAILKTYQIRKNK